MRLQHARRTVGITLMGGALLLAALTPLAATAAEGEGEGEEQRVEAPENTEQIEVSRRAYWNADNSKYSDNVATSQFPPEAVCLVQPQACFFPEGEQDPTSEVPTSEVPGIGGDGAGAVGNEATGEVNNRQQALLAGIATADEGNPPADPVPPDNSPVSIAFGKPNYRAAVQFALPELAEGQQLSTFQMVLQQGQPTYANESPAFRRAVLAALTCASENEESPIRRCSQEEFEKIPDQELRGDSPLTIEACPITGQWAAGVSQDEDTLPEVDCLFTAQGNLAADGVSWVFDLTFAAQAWYDGSLSNNGLLLRPGAAENFAFGDPETTYSKQVTFLPEVAVAVATTEAPAPPPSAPPPSSGTTTTAPPTSQGGFAPPPSTPSSTGSVGVPASSSPPDTSVDQPAVSEPAPQSAPAAEQQQTLAAGTPLGQPETPIWTWPLLALLFLIGAWLMARSLEEEAEPATERSGAMTRLLERRALEQERQLVGS